VPFAPRSRLLAAVVTIAISIASIAILVAAWVL
jgi:hypothetical protein